MPQIYGPSGEVLSGATPDATSRQVRLDRYGALFTKDPFNPKTAAGEQSRFAAANGTPGTGIALTTATRTTWLATEAALFLRNTAGAAGVSVYLDYIRLICTGAGTGATALDMLCLIDSANRYSSGGTAVTPANCNSATAGAPFSSVFAGPVTLTAAGGTAKLFNRARIKTQAAPCLTVGDEIYLNFCGIGSGYGAISGAAAVQVEKALSPVVLGPGSTHCFALYLWGAGMTAAPTFEFDIGLTER